MKVTLIDYTGRGVDDDGRYAANLLVFTKSTRLKMNPGLLAEIAAKPWDEILKELEYMAKTIPSSWEFAHLTFSIEGVTRAFTHQFVRSRTCSFAQQTMRVLDVDGWEYGTGPTIEDHKYSAKPMYDHEMARIAALYSDMIKQGVAIEDARGILPTNILTNICVSMNLRTFVEMIQKRSSPRVQGEYRQVLEAMEQEVMKVWPWAEMFINSSFNQAAKELDKEIAELQEHGIISTEMKLRVMKLVDQMRQRGA